MELVFLISQNHDDRESNLTFHETFVFRRALAGRF